MANKQKLAAAIAHRLVVPAWQGLQARDVTSAIAAATTAQLAALTAAVRAQDEQAVGRALLAMVAPVVAERARQEADDLLEGDTLSLTGLARLLGDEAR